MSFWKLSDGNVAEKTATHEVGGFELIPEGTSLLAVIDEAQWKSGYEGAPDVISIRWSVLAPEEYKNRKVFQNLKVNDAKETTADNAKRMLMAIDTNAGGKLSELEHEPDDNDLMAALMNKSMIISLGVWSHEGKEGNWVRAVAPRNKKPDAPKAAASTKAKAKPTAAQLDDEIPF